MLGVVYLLTDVHAAARLVVSMASLREHYAGPVCLFTSKPESHKLGETIAADPRLEVEHRTLAHHEADNRYTAAYLTKSTVLAASPYPVTVFLDADTLVVGSVDELLTFAQSGPITVTPYGPWTTRNDDFVERLTQWDQLVEADPVGGERVRERIEQLKRRPQPWINTGVLALHQDAALVAQWAELARWGQSTQVPEEVAFQLCLTGRPYQLLGHHFNCLPQFPAPPDVRIYHFAGQAHLKYEAGRKLWIPALDACRRDNLGGIRTWSKLVPPNRDTSTTKGIPHQDASQD